VKTEWAADSCKDMDLRQMVRMFAHGSGMKFVAAIEVRAENEFFISFRSGFDQFI
jgi:hypothetical protein